MQNKVLLDNCCSFFLTYKIQLQLHFFLTDHNLGMKFYM